MFIYYTLVDRLIKIDDKTRVKIFKNRPKAKYGKGEKMPPKHNYYFIVIVKLI